MPKYTVLWTSEAETDAMNIVDYFNNTINALAAINQLEEKALSLELFPDSGRIVPELRDIGVLPYREVLHKPWRMIYKVGERNDVWIMAIIDGRRDIASLLFERCMLQ